MAKKQLKKKIQHHSDTFYITRQNPGIVQSWNDSRTQVNRNRRETREAISRASIMVPSSAPEIAIPYNGTPVKDKTTHVSYIGGDRDAARKAYWEEAPIIKAATDSIAGRYGINPELLRSRLNKEGFTDSAINLYNGINTNVDADNRNNIRAKVLGYPYLHSEGEHNIGIQRFGLDDGATYINSGLAHLINESWNNGEFTNEKGRVTNAANGASILDNMGIMASLIKGFRDQAAKDYPNATPEELDNYANIYYNRGITGGRNYINNGNGSTPYTMAEGGSLQTHKPWNNLSMAEKAEMIGVAVRNGITSLPEIRAKYNEFAEGGKADTRYQHTEPDVNLYAGGGYMEKAKSMIRANEGWRSKPYKDAPKGKNWRSVGYGFNDSGFWERYPEGISKHYENGITKAQAEKELDYFLGKAERQLRGIYGKRWNNFNDDQKAAILDTYYQRPASVGSKSGFYGAVMSGKDGAPYLGVQGFGDRNQSRRDLYRGRGVTAPVSFESIAEPVPDDDVIHFEPLNPQVFGMQLPAYQAPVIDTIDTTDKAATIDKTYDPAAIEKQERQDNLRRFGMFMNMLDGASGQDSGMPDFIDMLAGKPVTYGKGGHLYDGTTENSQQMQQGYIRQRPEGSYFYDVQGQPAIDVTPLNTSLSDNPADWTFTDALGKIYNPHREAVKSTGELSESIKEGPLVSAVNNYFRELNWRMQNDPSSVWLQGKYTMPLVFSPLLGQGAATALANPYVDAAITSAFAGHGLNHAINEGIDGWGDATMTALEITPLGRLAKPVYEGVVQPGMRLFNSPLTGNWTKIGNREYRLSPNSLGANGSLIESRMSSLEGEGLNRYDVMAEPSKITTAYRTPRTPQITAENAASINPEQWTAAQDAAIARGDMDEAQRLRDLHFKVNTPQNRLIDAEGNPVKMIHGSQSKFTEFKHKDNPYGAHGRGMYFGMAPKNGITNYGGKNGYKYLTYLNGKSIYPDIGILVRDNTGKVIPNDIMYEIIGTNSYDEFVNSVTNQFKDRFEKYNQFYDLKNINNNIDRKTYQRLHDSFDTKMSGVHNIHKKKHWFRKDEKYTTFNPERAGEIVVRDANQIKSADAVTYDDNGVRIPLGDRDNFNVNDIRYGLLPIGIGLAGYGLNQKR